MKIGNLVNIVQEIGCHTPPQYRRRGFGIVLDIAKSKPIKFDGVNEVYLGDDVTVQLGTGETEVFNIESLKIMGKNDKIS